MIVAEVRLCVVFQLLEILGHRAFLLYSPRILVFMQSMQQTIQGFWNFYLT